MADTEPQGEQEENVVDAQEEAGEYNDESYCLLLNPDDAEGEAVKSVMFKRDTDKLTEGAAAVLGLKDASRVRCFHLPMFDKHGYAVHMYFDLEGTKHSLPHNTNATQLFFIANLPAEPPELQPDSIQGPVLLTAEKIPEEVFLDLGLEQWEKMKDICHSIQPVAYFSA